MSTAVAIQRTIWLDYLRAFITLLVVAHHAALAYPTFAHFDAAHYIYSTAPVVDASRWAGMDVFIGFNDLFFMPLMFLLSGLFVFRGLTKKGPNAYLADRLMRLGIPFLIAELLLIPLAYGPSFYLATKSTDVSAFLTDYLTKQQWPVGPPWFIWLLLAFDGVATLMFTRTASFFLVTGQWLTRLSQRPFRFSAVVYGLVALSLTPLSLWVGQYTWVGNWGPFDFQLNRLLLYGLFYLLGSCLGATDWQACFFPRGKWLGQGWPFWVGSSVVMYGLFMGVSRLGAGWVGQGHLTATQGYWLYDLTFVASCLASVSACLSVFRQQVKHPDVRWSSLSANAYGIYVVHYGFVTWLQFALLPLTLPVVVKVTAVFVIASSLSWSISHLARRNRWIARIL